MNAWEMLRVQFAAEEIALDAKIPFPDTDVRDRVALEYWLETENENTRSELDKAVAQFVTHGTWPSLSPAAKFLLKLRLGFALYFLDQLIDLNENLPTIPAQAPTPALKVWLLDALWHRYHWPWLAFVALTLSK